MSRITALVLVLLVLFVPSARAQHAFSAEGASYDPAIPTPRSVLGYEVGERFTPHHLLMRYVERVAAASDKVRVDTVAHTFEGREVLAIYVSSAANLTRFAQIEADAQSIAGVGSAASAGDAANRLPAIAWLGFTVHGNEASGVEAAIALLYQLAAGRDPETQLILDSSLVILDPVQNPDGHERHVQDVMRRRGATALPTSRQAMVHGGAWPGARTSHYLFDLNRDWFILSHPETRGRVSVFRRFWPHVAVDLHEMGSNSTYFFAPPMEPVNKNVHESIVRWWDIYAAANAAAFDARGWSYFRREGYDEFYPGYGVSWPILTGAVGMTYEQASSAGGAIRRSDGTVLTLRDAALHHFTAAWATILTTAQRARERVRDYASFRQSAVTDAQRAGMRGVAFARDAQGRADSLVVRLRENGIAVASLATGAALSAATSFDGGRAGAARMESGGYWVDFAQPQGRLAKA
ncbi:MAG TPA: M14 family zinc carboxypeptidase, partial [Gemmatimonadaceae bacterium]|nr:M14 family zinc carboxypeptidase [Gemmatimonadaceae bacterium]